MELLDNINKENDIEIPSFFDAKWDATHCRLCHIGNREVEDICKMCFLTALQVFDSNNQGEDK